MVKILNHTQIEQKIKRLAFQIYENNHDQKELYFLGINNNGKAFAEMILSQMKSISDIDCHLYQILLNPAIPTDPIKVNAPIALFDNKRIIIVDDVANTGRTIFYAAKPFLDIIPQRIEIAVLVDRQHKHFPIKVDFMGLTLATTFKDNIDVKIRDIEEMAVYLS